MGNVKTGCELQECGSIPPAGMDCRVGVFVQALPGCMDELTAEVERGDWIRAKKTLQTARVFLAEVEREIARVGFKGSEADHV